MGSMNSPTTRLPMGDRQVVDPHAGHAAAGAAYDGGTGMDHGMPMFFHFGVTETVLFKFWHTDSVIGTLLSI